MKGLIKILFFLVCVFLAACGSDPRQLPEPNFDPYLIKPENFKTVKGKVVDMDSMEAPSFLPLEKNYQKAGDPFVVELDTAEKLYIEKALHPTTGKKVRVDSLLRYPVVAFKKEKVAGFWPTYKPAKLTFTGNMEIPATILNVDEGLTSPFASFATQSRDGRIWIRTNGGGVNVWDGSGISYFSSEEGFPESLVRGIYENTKGHIWITTNQLYEWDGQHLFLYDFGDNFNPGWSVVEDDEGQLWLGTWNGIMVRSKRGTFHKINIGKELDVEHLIKDKQGRIWIGTRHNGLWRFEKDSEGTGGLFTQYTRTEGLLGDSVRSLLEDHAGNIWAACWGAGISIWMSDEKNRSEAFRYVEPTDGLSGGNIGLMTETEPGVFWISVWGEGINVLDLRNGWEEGSINSLTEVDGLIGNYLRLFQTKEGKIWVSGPGNGIQILDPRYFDHYTQKQGIDFGTRRAMYKEKSGQIWVGSITQGIGIFGEGKYQRYSTAQGLQSSGIWTFEEDRQGRLWIGSNRGVILFDEQGFTQFYPDFYGVHDILETRKGLMLLASRSGLGVMSENGLYIHTAATGFTSSDISSFLEDSKGRIWIASWSKGLNIWEPTDNGTGGRVIQFVREQGLSNDMIIHLMEDRRGNIWAGTIGGGLLLIQTSEAADQFSFIQITEKEGLVSNHLSRAITQDEEGGIWVSGYYGLNWLRWQAAEGGYRLKSFTKEDGLMNTTITSLVQGKEEDIWVGTAEGVTRFKLNDFEESAAAPVLRIQSLIPYFEQVNWRQVKECLRDGKEVTLQEPALSLATVDYDSVYPFTNLPVSPSFPYQINQLTFRWMATHGEPHKLQYSYFLAGSDRAWSPLVKENTVTYTDLRPGRYTFKIRAVGGNSRWSETASYTFVIRPPWWQTNLAYALYVLLMAGVIWSFIRWRLYYLRLHYEREAALTAEASAKEANEAKSNFLSTVSHELRTPLTSIIGFTKIVKSRLEDRVFPFVQSEEKKTKRAMKQASDNLGVVMQEGERLTALINDLLDLAKIESGKVDWKMVEVDPAELIERAVASTAALFDQKPALDLITEVPDELPAFTGDRDRLLQVLINLISNAVKFTDRGHVKIGVNSFSEENSGGRLEHLPGDMINSDAKGPKLLNRADEVRPAKLLHFFVEDTGTGISPDQLDEVFEKFKQVNDNQAGKPKGTGLGLPICKEIVEHHSGKIWVESKVGKGSVFAFSLPLQKRALAEALE